jgi:hypothetical protein
MDLQALYSARQLVLADKALYDKIWTSVLDNPSMSSAIAELSSLVQDIAAQSVSRPLQVIRVCSSAEARASGLVLGGTATPWLSGVLRASSSMSVNSFAAFASSGRMRADSSLDSEDGASDFYLQPVDSLDQLYYQAVALNPLLIAKVQSWAECSGGCFSGTSAAAAAVGACSSVVVENENIHCDEHRIPSGFIHWRDVQEIEQVAGGQVQWAKVKSVQRSIEKSTRSYGKVCSCVLVQILTNKVFSIAQIRHNAH